MLVRLKHYSNLAGATGNPGDVVDVPEQVAAEWLATAGAEECEQGEDCPAQDPADGEDCPDGCDDCKGEETCILDSLNKANLTEFITARGGVAPKSATKADLLELAKELKDVQTR